MLRRVSLLLLAPSILVVITACGGGGGSSSVVPTVSQSPGAATSGSAPDPKPTATDVPAKDTLRGGIAIGEDGLIYVSGQTGLDQFTQSLAPVASPAPSSNASDTWPHIGTSLVPAGPVTSTWSTVSALATLPAGTAGRPSAPLQPVLVQFDTTTQTWQPVVFIDNIADDTFNAFVQGPGISDQPIIIGNRAIFGGFLGFLAIPNLACGTPPFSFIFSGAFAPFGVGAQDSNGLVWVASNPAMNSKAPSNAQNPSEIFTIDPNSSQLLRTVPLQPGSQVNGMVLGPDNAIWFTDGGLNEIGRIDQNGNVSHFPLTRLPHLQPQGITVGADGNLWFTELLGNRIGRIIPSTGNITEFMVPTTNAQPNGIIGCQNGNPCPTTRAVFFTEIQKVGKVKGF